MKQFNPNTLTPFEEGAIDDYYENLEEEDFEEEDEDPLQLRNQ